FVSRLEIDGVVERFQSRLEIGFRASVIIGFEVDVCQIVPDVRDFGLHIQDALVKLLIGLPDLVALKTYDSEHESNDRRCDLRAISAFVDKQRRGDGERHRGYVKVAFRKKCEADSFEIKDGDKHQRKNHRPEPDAGRLAVQLYYEERADG